jgi:cell division protein FtsB
MSRIWNYIKTINKYGITFIFFGVLMLFLGDFTLIDNIRLGREKVRLEAEIAEQKAEKRRIEEQLNTLRNNDEGLEKFAREQFQMTAPDEDLFIIK